MPKKLTHLEFIDRIKSINSEIEVLGLYKSSYEKILVKHSCGREWMVTPANLLKGRGCAKCNGKLSPTHEEYVSEIKKLNPTMKILGKYKNNKTNILVRHSCGYEWEVSPVSLRKFGCPKCSNLLKIDDVTFKKQMQEINPDITLLSKYKNARTIIKFKHHCGYEWYSTPNNLKSGHGCNKCNRSKSENEIYKYLSDNIKYKI